MSESARELNPFINHILVSYVKIMGLADQYFQGNG